MEPEKGADAAVLLYAKPAGVTSHDVVALLRRERGIKRVGHAGTLDPFATGLLLILFGRATRLQRYLMGLPKTYVATARLGWRSSTGDPDGELVETGHLPSDLALPTGRITQCLPMTSAVRVDGERLYRKAHRGETVATPEREVKIHRAELLHSEASRATFEVECSSGTYIRTLIETLEDAYCEALERTAIGPLRLADAGTELSPNEALSFLPERALDPDEAEAISHGRPVPASEVDGSGGAEDRTRLTFNGRLLAVARADGNLLRSEVVLP